LSIYSTIASFSLPPFQGDVFNLDFLQELEIGREVRDFVSLIEIFDSDFDFGEIIKDVEFCEIKGGVAVDLVGVTELNKVEPAATTSATGGCSEFVACFLEVCADVLQ
jgi:hypothetical protein